jgi:hypothetical protein
MPSKGSACDRSRYANARLVEFEGSGYSTFSEEPELFSGTGQRIPSELKGSIGAN